MPPVTTADNGTGPPYTKLAGAEPLPGYKLLAPLGRGGFGEVWKCEAPGGLHKAIKFVTSESEDGRGDERFGQELAAFEQIKAIRHPFLLTLERVEQINGELIMVMELADRQLQDRFRECRTCGLPGVPRDELLAYFADAAEALDVIAAKFGLQHLDVKPANLFLVSGHVKVGDYGLVAQLEGPDAGNRGLTPRYVAPEVLHGTPSSASDQYSLALVYQELLTGEFPYTGRTPQQLMLQHVSAQPNLSVLPPADQEPVARALAKKPENRFPSCLAFVQALMSAESATALPNASVLMRRARVDRSVAEMNLGDGPPGDSSVAERSDPTHPGRSRPAPLTQSFTLPVKPPLTVPGAPRGGLPPLVANTQKGLTRPGTASPTVHGRPAPGPVGTPRPAAPAPPPPPLFDGEFEAGLVVLEQITSVIPVALLLGMEPTGQPPDPQTFAAAVVGAAAGGYVSHVPGDVNRLPDGGWECRFPTTVPVSVVPLKLAVLRESWGVSVEQPDPGRLVLKRTVGGGGLFGGKKFGFEVTVTLPPAGRPIGEIGTTAQLVGTPDPKFARDSERILPELLGDIRGQLCNVQDRRKTQRIAAGGVLTVYPLHGDGGVDPAVEGRCRDVSLGGLGFATPVPVATKYAYIAFPNVGPAAGHAVLVRLLRAQHTGREHVFGAQYRTDL
ncbi:serine/threonine-protein kinase [Gemmata sp. JC717]|uniref:protein kinase domain-containing protein n=1 Tax=Gemmata algarum TaxID=2975278 RepID=UPI0021BA8279|nr:serine/threonine-protein kinase [Gemmata algarum]MDY3554264.1 serine/threonine-protein kinase [Gemmata algarum]